MARYVIIAAAIGLIILVVVAIAFLVYSCAAAFNSFKINSTWPDYCEYDINISGLDNYTGSDLTGILVPLPMIDGEPALIPGDDGGYDRHWSTTIVSTGHGKMIALYTNDRNLSNIDTWCGTDISKLNKDFPAGSPLTALMERPLSPIANAPGDAAGGIHNYTSYVYIDRNMTPKYEDAAITIDLNLTLSGESIEGKYGKRYHAVIHETIPAGRRGMIPVSLQISDPAMGER